MLSTIGGDRAARTYRRPDDFHYGFTTEAQQKLHNQHSRKCATVQQRVWRFWSSFSFKHVLVCIFPSKPVLQRSLRCFLVFAFFCLRKTTFLLIDFPLWFLQWSEAMNRTNESNPWIESMHRLYESNQRIESMNRIHESNQWIESMNRINESNQ